MGKLTESPNRCPAKWMDTLFPFVQEWVPIPKPIRKYRSGCIHFWECRPPSNTLFFRLGPFGRGSKPRCPFLGNLYCFGQFQQGIWNRESGRKGYQGSGPQLETPWPLTLPFRGSLYAPLASISLCRTAARFKKSSTSTSRRGATLHPSRTHGVRAPRSTISVLWGSKYILITSR